MNHRTRRRAALAWIAVLAGAALAACGSSGRQVEESGASQAVSSQAAPRPATEYVGRVSGTDALVALLTSSQEGNATPVRAYFCDGKTIFEWFTGTMEGGTVQLSSKDGARLTGTLAAGASGTITLADGRTFPFEAPVATGFAGLFEVTSSPAGVVESTSLRGNRLTGQIEQSPSEDGRYPLNFEIRSVEGPVLSVGAHVVQKSQQGSRWIVSADGQSVKGTDVHPMQTRTAAVSAR